MYAKFVYGCVHIYTHIIVYVYTHFFFLKKKGHNWIDILPVDLSTCLGPDGVYIYICTCVCTHEFTHPSVCSFYMCTHCHSCAHGEIHLHYKQLFLCKRFNLCMYILCCTSPFMYPNITLRKPAQARASFKISFLCYNTATTSLPNKFSLVKLNKSKTNAGNLESKRKFVI